MAKILTVAAQKGGVSKTTTAAAIAQYLAYQGKRTLLIDTDAQGSATHIYGADQAEGSTIFDAIIGRQNASDIIQHTEAGDIIASSPKLASLDVILYENKNRDYFLKKAVEPLGNMYDYIVIDTPPGLSTCLIQALTAADSVIIPLLCDSQALQGLIHIAQKISDVQRRCNPALEIAGIVITNYQGRAVLTRQYEALLAEQCEKMGLYLTRTRIRRAIAVQEAQAMRKSLYKYAPYSNPALDYAELIKELKL